MTMTMTMINSKGRTIDIPPGRKLWGPPPKGRTIHFPHFSRGRRSEGGGRKLPRAVFFREAFKKKKGLTYGNLIFGSYGTGATHLTACVPNV